MNELPDEKNSSRLSTIRVHMKVSTGFLEALRSVKVTAIKLIVLTTVAFCLPMVYILYLP